ncbi:hypothetical protein, partial [Paenibacillus favisporus]|uniref:hypothetical protein n=1 Tax=Paenibacillus favisporus TaxID=221028 RepID=UPI003D295FD3
LPAASGGVSPCGGCAAPQGREWVRAVLRCKAFGWRARAAEQVHAGDDERGLMLRSRTAALQVARRAFDG